MGKQVAFEVARIWAVESDIKLINLGLDGPANGPATLTDRRAARIREKAATEGVTPGLHTLSAVNMAEDSPFVRDAVDASMTSYIDAAARLGCAWIVVHAGHHFTGDVARRTEVSLERLHRLGDAAGAKGMRPLLKNMNKESAAAEVYYLACYLDECQGYFDALPAETVG